MILRTSTGGVPGSLLRACLGLFGLIVAANVMMVALLLFARDSWPQAIEKTALQPVRALALPAGSDSWGPMANAYEDARAGRDMYRVFFEGLDRFQYPPTALLLHDAFPQSLAVAQEELAPGTPFNRGASLLSRLGVLASIAAAAALLLISIERLHGIVLGRRDRLLIAAAFAGCGLLFYPLLYPHMLGQVQVFVNLFLILALLCWATGARASAGLLLGVCALIKPQYGLLLLWAVVARQWRFAVAMAATGALGLLLSCLAFGLQAHLRYLEVLQFLSRHGESFWPNQSTNGLMHRLLGNGSAREFLGFPPYNVLVHVATVASSVLILAVAFLPLPALRRQSPVGPQDARRTTFAFGAFLAATTLASPIAWEHHYGFFIGLHALLVPALVHARPGRRIAWLAFIAAFVATASVFKHPDFLFAGTVPTLLAAHLYLGALVLFALLVTEARRSMPARE